MISFLSHLGSHGGCVRRPLHTLDEAEQEPMSAADDHAHQVATPPDNETSVLLKVRQSTMAASDICRPPAETVGARLCFYFLLPFLKADGRVRYRFAYQMSFNLVLPLVGRAI